MNYKGVKDIFVTFLVTLSKPLIQVFKVKLTTSFIFVMLLFHLPLFLAKAIKTQFRLYKKLFIVSTQVILMISSFTDPETAHKIEQQQCKYRSQRTGMQLLG